MEKRVKLAVIGGGAAGMMAAITAAREGAAVFLYEKNDRVGKKLLATGNGKCNFSNRDLRMDCYYGEDREQAWQILSAFDTEAAAAFFEAAGMMVKDKNGYLYPASGQASTVLDILRLLLQKEGVKVQSGSRVFHMAREKNGRIRVETQKEKQIYDRVILACGGKAAPKTGSDGDGYRLAALAGHTLIPVVPALVQLHCSEPYLKACAGVRTEARLTLVENGRPLAKESGELQFTEYGISGIVVFQLSRLASYGLLQKKKMEMYIDCLPEYNGEAYADFIKRRKSQNTAETVEDFFTGMLHKKLMLLFIKLAGLKPADSYESAEEEKIDRVFSLCKKLVLPINGSHSFEHAQVCAGGIPLREVSPALESCFWKNLYMAGEMLDVDGICGGYNLQWAWASGYTAGKHAAQVQNREP